jgi:hypothetical protein
MVFGQYRDKSITDRFVLAIRYGHRHSAFKLNKKTPPQVTALSIFKIIPIAQPPITQKEVY